MMAEHLAQWFVDVWGAVLGTDLFIGTQPDSDDIADCITLYDTPAPVLPESQGLAVDAWGVQVLIRLSDYSSGKTALGLYHKALVGFKGKLHATAPMTTQTIIGSTPTALGRDRKGLHEFSVWYVFRVQSTGDSYRS